MVHRACVFVVCRRAGIVEEVLFQHLSLPPVQSQNLQIGPKGLNTLKRHVNPPKLKIIKPLRPRSGRNLKMPFEGCTSATTPKWLKNRRSQNPRGRLSRAAARPLAIEAISSRSEAISARRRCDLAAISCDFGAICRRSEAISSRSRATSCRFGRHECDRNVTWSGYEAMSVMCTVDRLGVAVRVAGRVVTD